MLSLGLGLRTEFFGLGLRIEPCGLVDNVARPADS